MFTLPLSFISHSVYVDYYGHWTSLIMFAPRIQREIRPYIFPSSQLPGSSGPLRVIYLFFSVFPILIYLFISIIPPFFGSRVSCTISNESCDPLNEMKHNKELKRLIHRLFFCSCSSNSFRWS